MKSLLLPHPPPEYPGVSAYRRRLLDHLLRAQKPGVEALKVLAMQQHCAQYKDDSQRLYMMEVISCLHWLNIGQMKTIFPSAEIIRACKATDVLSTVNATDLRITYPSFMIVLPFSEGIAVPGSDARLHHIIVNHITTREAHCRIGGQDRGLTFGSDSYLLTTILWPNEDGQPGAFNLLRDIPLDECLRIHADQGLRLHSAITDKDMTPEEMIYESAAAIEFQALVFNLILLMQSYPEYVTSFPTRYRPHGSKHAHPTTALRICTPTTLRPPVVEREHHAPLGTHASPAAHWRRGHWRRQPHTERFEAAYPDVAVLVRGEVRYHMRWIKPLFIGPKTPLTSS